MPQDEYTALMEDPMAQKRLAVLAMLTATVVSSVLFAGCQPERRKGPAQTKAVPDGQSKAMKGPLWEDSQEKEKDKPASTKLSPTKQKEMDAADGHLVEAKNRCAVAICGDPGKLDTPSKVFSLKVPETAEAKTYFESELKPLIEKRIELGFQLAKKQMDLVERSKEKIKNIQPKRETQVVANILFATEHMNKVADAIQKDADGKYRLPESAIMAAYPGMPAQDRQFLMQFLEDIMDSKEYSQTQDLRTFKFSDYLKVHYKTSEAEARKKFAAEFTNAVKRLSSAFPVDKLRPPSVIFALAEGRDGDLTADELAEIPSLPFFNYIERHIQNSESIYARRPLQPQTVLAALEGNKVLLGIKSSIDDKDNASKLRNNAFGSCLNSLHRSFRTALDANDKSKMEEIISLMKESSKSVLAELGITGDDAQKAEAALAKVQFGMPLDRSQLQVALKKAAQKRIQEADARLKAIDKGDDQLALLMAYAFALKPPSFTGGAREICRLFEPSEVLSDHMINMIGKVNLSWQTVRFRRFGSGFLAHELGHVVWKAVKKSATRSSKLGDVKQCLVDKKEGLTEEAYDVNDTEDGSKSFDRDFDEGDDKEDPADEGKDGDAAGGPDAPVADEAANRLKATKGKTEPGKAEPAKATKSLMKANSSRLSDEDMGDDGNAEAAKERSAKPNDSLEEDFADTFAARVMGVLAKKSNVNFGNAFCLLLGDDGQRYGTRAGLALRWPPSHVDNHSPDFYRLLLFQGESGKEMPAACEEFNESIGSGRPRFSSCVK